MVLNKVNKELVGLMQKMGINAVGICGKDAGHDSRWTRRCRTAGTSAFVGNVKSVNTETP